MSQAQHIQQKFDNIMYSLQEIVESYANADITLKQLEQYIDKILLSLEKQFEKSRDLMNSPYPDTELIVMIDIFEQMMEIICRLRLIANEDSDRIYTMIKNMLDNLGGFEHHEMTDMVSSMEYFLEAV